MQVSKNAKRLINLLTVCAMLCTFLLSGAAIGYADTPLQLSHDDIKLMGKCDAVVEGNTITVTDEEFNEDVWSSKLLVDTGMDFTPGEMYTISFELSGENGVGEFFLCKGETLDVRYDETFTNGPGNKTIAFTPIQNKVYIGMQMGDLGYDHSVTAKITNLSKLSESACPQILRAENCEVSVADGVITATDNQDNNDVWNSKLLYDPGVDLEPGRTYMLHFDLAGDNGVGELFVCKSQDLNDRYDSSFVNYPCSGGVVFKAESEKAYIGMQFGNIGKGNSVTVKLGELGGFLPDAPEKEPDDVYCSCVVDGDTFTVTDLSPSDNVWDSRMIYDAGIELEPGKKYELRFSLSGDNGVGEFFLLKSKNINDRYDETFTNASGEKTVVFTAEDTKAYIGMQVGNLGLGNSVTLTIDELKEYDESAQTEPRMLLAENCSYDVETVADQTSIGVMDTSDNNDVWNSKVLYFLGNILEKGKFYAANITLAGSNGVGEFFFCKQDNLDDRYTYDNTEGDHTVKFQAEDSKLYAGMQFGDIGVGNIVTAVIRDIFRIPGMQRSGESCFETLGQDAITLTDIGESDDVWTSKAIFDTGLVLEPGKTYTATFTLSGDNGVGEFFFLKSENIDDRYTFDNVSGTHTVTFTAEDAPLFFGIQCGNLGAGNSVTVSDISVVAVEDNEPAPAQEPAEEAAPAEEPAEAQEPAEETEAEPAEEAAPAEEPAEEAIPAEETEAAVEEPAVAEEPAPETAPAEGEAA